jgi:hypothetical protein
MLCEQKMFAAGVLSAELRDKIHYEAVAAAEAALKFQRRFANPDPDEL